MVASSFQPSLAFVWRPENDGQSDHTDPGDSGGETNMGVTIASWNDAVAAGLVDALRRERIAVLGPTAAAGGNAGLKLPAWNNV